MIELIDTRPDANVQESEYQRLLGYPAHHALEGRSRELADDARQWYSENGRPWVYARQVNGLVLAKEHIQISGVNFNSHVLHEQLSAAQAHSAVLVAVSAGPQCEAKARELWQAGKPDEYFFMEMFGSAVVEHLITTTGGRICAWAEQNSMTVLPHYSPGYSGWDVSEQSRLWQLIRNTNVNHLQHELEVMETGMLRPKKSLLAVFGVTHHVDEVRQLGKLVPCETCALPRCAYRRVPYVHSRPPLEDVHRLRHDAGMNDESRNGHALNHRARYALNLKALQKWSRQQLQLKPLADGGFEAHFRYAGTTCTNLGHALAFDYHLKLGSRDNRYAILDSSCTPAPGDTGHTQQCEYIANGADLMQKIATEKPLLGRPLDEILNWERPYNPSGCYCDADRRLHKWGLVLEVVHYALVQHEKSMAEKNSNQSQNQTVISS